MSARAEVSFRFVGGLRVIDSRVGGLVLVEQLQVVEEVFSSERNDTLFTNPPKVVIEPGGSRKNVALQGSHDSHNA